jgi:hypothetical protein
MRFLRCNFWAIVCSLSFVAGLVIALSASGWLFWFGVVASLGTGVSALYLWMEPIWAEPWEHTYHTEDWWSDGRGSLEMPQIVVKGNVHKKGRKPKVEFERADPRYGVGDLEWTYIGEYQEDVLITRPRSSVPPFGPVIVRIRK